MNTELLEYTDELIHHFKEFLSQYNQIPPMVIADFGQWLKDQELLEKNSLHEGKPLDPFIGIELVALSNIVRNKLNRFVSNSPFSTFMDYQFLFVLAEHGEMTKSQIISYNFMEMSTGVEVVKRLIKHEWLSEKENPKDKRSKLVSITEEGNELVKKFKEEADQLYANFSNSLVQPEKKKTCDILEKIISQNTLKKDLSP